MPKISGAEKLGQYTRDKADQNGPENTHFHLL
jgi:hypothetical protein